MVVVGAVVVGAVVVGAVVVGVVVVGATVVVGDGASAEPVKSNLFGEPIPTEPRAFVVAPVRTRAATCAGLREGSPPRIRAAAPATCGAAIDVPLSVRMIVSPVCDAEAIPCKTFH